MGGRPAPATTIFAIRVDTETLWTHPVAARAEIGLSAALDF